MQTTEIINSLKSLSPEMAMVYGIHQAKRMISNYKHFQKIEGFGDFEVLQECLVVGQGFLINSIPDGLDELNDRLLTVIPHSEDFGSVLSSYALNAAATCSCLLKIASQDSSNPAVEIFDYAIDDIFILVQENGISKEMGLEEIYADKLMIGELEFHSNLLLEIRSSSLDELILEVANVKYEVSNVGFV